MNDLFRDHDANLTRRSLRDALYRAYEDLGRDHPAIPHTFETAELLDFASRTLRLRDVRETTLFDELSEAGARAACACGAQQLGEAFLARALAEVDSPMERGRFLYLQALLVHLPKGELALARNLILEALECAQWSRTLRTKTQILFGRTELQLGDPERAEAAYQEVLTSGVRELRPVALDQLAMLRAEEGHIDDAIRLNRQSHRGMRLARNERGMRRADQNLAAILIQGGRYREAVETLEEFLRDSVRILDLEGSGRAYYNLGLAHRALRNPAAAQSAFLQSTRYLAEGGRVRSLYASFRSLGQTLADAGNLESALAAFERAIAVGVSAGVADLELEARTDAIMTLSRHRTRLAAIPPLIAGCRALLETKSDQVGRTTLVTFSRVMTGLWEHNHTPSSHQRGPGRPFRLSTPGGRAALAALGGPREGRREFEELLAARLGAGLRGRFGPPPDSLRRFLMLFTGDYFRFGIYAREFGLSMSHAKPHLHELCHRGIVELIGLRKAARYALAFHRS